MWTFFRLTTSSPERVEPPKRRQTVSFEFQPAPRSGDDVVNLRGVHKRYGKRVIYDGLDLLVRRKERCCVMGINGAGKSTLLKLVTGSTAPETYEASGEARNTYAGASSAGWPAPACVASMPSGAPTTSGG